MKELNQNFNIEEGTVSFWVKENQVDYGNNILYPLIDLRNEKGAIVIFKDSDKKIKFFYVREGEQRNIIEWSCSSLGSNKKHMITATWNYSDKKIKLYIDGDFVCESKIKD